jgi:hypothetical protein
LKSIGSKGFQASAAPSIISSDVPSMKSSDVPSIVPSIIFGAKDLPVSIATSTPSSHPTLATLFSEPPTSLSTLVPFKETENEETAIGELTCEKYNYPASNKPFRVCYIPSSAAISSMAMIDENTIDPPASQVYWYNYTIYNQKNLLQYYVISAERSGEVLNGGQGTDLTTCQYVAVAGMPCTSCSYCGNNTMSADCTNLQYGRVATCEPLLPLFFPFESEAA